MTHNLPAPTQRLFRPEAGVVQPALIDKIRGTVRPAGPRRHGNRVDDEEQPGFGLPGLFKSFGRDLPVFGVNLAAGFFGPPFRLDQHEDYQHRYQESSKSQV